MNKKPQGLIVTVAVFGILLLIFGSQLFYVIKPGERTALASGKSINLL